MNSGGESIGTPTINMKLFRKSTKKKQQKLKSGAMQHGTDDGGDYVICVRCGLKSHNPNDIRYDYCENCHIFWAKVKAKKEQ